MNKKLYLAALSSDKEENKRILSLLEPLGYASNTRWMERGAIAKPYTKENVAQALADNFQDIHDADAYLVLPKESPSARGLYVEFGYILAEVEKNPAKELFLVSDLDPAFHWFHPRVQYFKTVDELVKSLKH